MVLPTSWQATLRFLALLSLCFVAACEKTEESNPADNPDQQAAVSIKPVTVSGISSGGYMATQTHIALSDIIKGAGIIAGGPYGCAEGELGKALGYCLNGGEIPVDSLVQSATSAAQQGKTASLDNLNSHRVWLFQSPKDGIVNPSVGTALAEFYQALMPGEQVKTVTDVDAAHGWPTMDSGGACEQLDATFLNDCDFDAAGDLLSFIYNQPVDKTQNRGSLQKVDFKDLRSRPSSIADFGFLFVPDACNDSNAVCDLHIAFHGCRQGFEFVGDKFIQGSGLNEAANGLQIAVLYPQIEKSLTNPQGCWDWWGYTGSDYDKNTGSQITFVRELISQYHHPDGLPTAEE